MSPTAQPFTCTATCRSGSNPTSIDCAQEIKNRLKTTDIIYSSSCNNSPGPEPSCTGTANWCNTETGARGTTSVTLTCNSPSSGGCGVGSPCYDEGGCLGCDQNCECTAYNPSSPVLIDVSGNGFALTNLSSGVWFDLDVRGRRGHTPWTATSSDDAFLSLDRNGNGIIDDGTELFGDMTPQPQSPEPNGFIALAEYDKPINDGNGDGNISSADAIYMSLLLWQDTDHNGISEANELYTLPSRSVASIDLNYKESKRIDEYGNQFRYRAKVRDAGGQQLGRWAWDVFFNSVP